MRRIRMLVLDDEPDMRDVIAEMASADGGFEVVGSVADAEAALDVARQHRPDVALIDHHLASPMHGIPDSGTARLNRMSGMEIVEYLRAARDDMLIVVHTGRPGLRSTATNAGADLCIEKGGNPADLLAEIKKAWTARTSHTA